MMLGKKKNKFTADIASLIIYAINKGWDLRFQPEHIRHKKNSLHFIGLAKDFDLFVDGRWVKMSSDIEWVELGEYWKSLSTDEAENCWGGDFDLDGDGKKFDDGNHFSIKHEGIR